LLLMTLVSPECVPVGGFRAPFERAEAAMRHQLTQLETLRFERSAAREDPDPSNVVRAVLTKPHALSRSETATRIGRESLLCRVGFTISAVLGLGGCATSISTPVALQSKPVCVVLSVGAENGLAHIGVLDALKQQGIEPRCVFGNSMGALVGGLYAAAPERDLSEHYRSVMAAYVDKTRRDAEGAAVLGFLFGVMLPASSGGGSLLAGAAGAGLGQASINESDRRRLVEVLRADFEDQTISELPVEFATWHDELRTGAVSGPVKVRMTSGSLAEAIGDSIANPLIFPDVHVERGSRLDPGADRVSAVPLDDACRLRPDAHFIVSNVTGHPLYLSASMNCTYDEIRIVPPKFDAKRTLLGEGADFDTIVGAGFAATNWTMADRAQRNTR
jgi:predicted acylesterase/phospholipase RssA